MSNEIQEFVSSFASTQLPNLSELEKFAKENYIPICSKPLAGFLHFMVATLKPKRVLEIGTAIGYSTIIMAKANKSTQIDTIEIDMDRLELAKQNIQAFNCQKQINTLCGDAGDCLFNLPDQSYDLIFLDGPKTQYYSYLSSLKRVLAPNGTIIADNIFQRGMTTGEKEVLNKHKSTINKMTDFVDKIANDKNFKSTILPMGDGVLISTRTVF